MDTQFTHEVITPEITCRKTDNSKKSFPSLTIFLFLFFVFYLTIPLIDIPLIGLSLSAPVFFLVALQVFLRPPESWFFQYRRWIFFALVIWIGIFISSAMNGLSSGGTKIDNDVILTVIQYIYWFLVFIITSYFVSRFEIIDRLIGVISVGIVLLAILRWGEAIFGGAIGAWTELTIFTQNMYGIQFSTFIPFLLVQVLVGRKRLLAIIAFILVLGAVAINGSRGSWISVSITMLVFLWIYFLAKRKVIRGFVLIIGSFLVFGSLLVFAPDILITSIDKRLATFQNISEDKPYLIRQLMIQKGLRLFEQHPIYGIGPSRWLKESVPLDIPSVLAYGSQSYFNRREDHNSYVSFLAESGLVASVPLGLLLITLVFRGYSASIFLSREGKFWAIGIFASFIGMSVHLWVLSGLSGTVPWFVYGLVAAMIETRKKLILESKSTTLK